MEPSNTVDNFINNLQQISTGLKELDDRQEALEDSVRQMEKDARVILADKTLPSEDRQRLVQNLAEFITTNYQRAMESTIARAAKQRQQEPAATDDVAAVGGFADAGFPRY